MDTGDSSGIAVPSETSKSKLTLNRVCFVQFLIFSVDDPVDGSGIQATSRKRKSTCDVQPPRVQQGLIFRQFLTAMFLIVSIHSLVKKFNCATFCLPTKLTVNLQQKIDKKKAFLPEDYSELCRTVRPFIEMETEDPSAENLLFVAHKLLEKYPSIVAFDYSVDNTAVIMFFITIRGICNYDIPIYLPEYVEKKMARAIRKTAPEDWNSKE